MQEEEPWANNVTVNTRAHRTANQRQPTPNTIALALFGLPQRDLNYIRSH
jgi:hypothetical protein